jgi:TonB-dependent SusC/RagA subfamily outer membrane receptor
LQNKLKSLSILEKVPKKRNYIYLSPKKPHMNFVRLFIGSIAIITSVAVSAQEKLDSNKLSKALIIIDGREYQNVKLSDLDSLVNPNEISSIDVLKGQGAISLYGEKGKNGVLFIHTKNKDGSSVKNIDLDTTRTGSKIQPREDDEDKIFEKSEVEASFPGGNMGWKSFLIKNLNGAVGTEHGAPAGTYTVWLQFIVDKEGNISNIKTLTHQGYGMEEECLRLMKLSPKWTPAMQNGHVVKAYKRQPITFVIEIQ